MKSQSLQSFYKKALSILRIRERAAGLEVSDQAARLVFSDGKTWRTEAVRFGAGVVAEGDIKDKETFVAALRSLRERAVRGGRKKMSVVLSMSSARTYTQVFPLPDIRGRDLDEAVALNLQMVSPLEGSKDYSGWQVIGRDEKTMRLEILSAFTLRAAVDEMVDALFEAGFLVTAVESKAFALARVLREQGAGFDAANSYLIVDLDEAGIDFLIVRKGSLYFEYAVSWKDLADEKGEIPLPRFEATFAAEMRRVMSFYGQHFEEPLGAVILSAVALGDQAAKIIAEIAPPGAVPFVLGTGERPGAEWLTALGCSLRDAGVKGGDREVNLLGPDSRDRFHEEQLVSFMDFWRIVIPVAFGILVLTFIAADIFLGSTKAQIESYASIHLGATQTAEVQALEQSAVSFNRSVALAAAAEKATNPKSVMLQDVITAAAANYITISRVTFSSFTSPISVSGSGVSQAGVIAFKEALAADPRVSQADLPLTAIQAGAGQVSFSMTFVFTP